MNIAESNALERAFIAHGWEKSSKSNSCDVAIINSCAIRESAEERTRGRLGYYLGQKRARSGSPYLIFTGCMAERLKDTIKKDFPFVDCVLGNFQKDKIEDVIKSLECILLKKNEVSGDFTDKNSSLDSQSNIFIPQSEKDEYHFFPLTYDLSIKSQFIAIMHGCNNFCTYCVVPYLRGREISRDPAAILKELDTLSTLGTKEIILLGQNVNSYSYGDLTFPALLSLIGNHIHKTDSPIKWIRFLSSHPKDLSPDLIDVMKSDPLVAPALHLPLQAGSDKTLLAMNRHYTRADYLNLVRQIKKAVPKISLSTDIMTGFPGETEDDFRETLSLMEEIKFTSSMMYYYNVRPGTKAALLPQVPIEIRKERLDRVIALQLNHTKIRMAEHLGEVVYVLAEKPSRDDGAMLLGKTPFNTKIAFRGEGSLIGSFLKVKITSLDGNTYNGEIYG